MNGSNAIQQDDLLMIGRQAQAALSGKDPEQEALFVEIEGYTRDDFNQDDPYLFVLTSHNNDELLYGRLKNKLFDQAKAVKFSVSDAKKQLAIMEKRNKELLPVVGGTQTAPVSGFSGMDRFFGNNMVNYGTYDCSDAGIMARNPMGVPFTVCSHPIFISKRSIDVSDKEAPEEALDVTWWMDGSWKTLKKIPREKLVSKTSIVKLLASRGIDVTDESAKNLMTFLSAFDHANRQIIPRVKMTRVIGWTDGNTFAPITGDVEMASFQKSDFNDIAGSIGKHGDPAVWFDGVKSLRAHKDSVKARIAMAGAFASPMLQKLNFSPFWVHMEGKTGSAKTVALRLCASIYAYTNATGGYMRSMDNTDVGLEVLAGFIRNLPLCLNEMQRIKDPKTLPKKVYMITEGSGRGRGNTDINLRESAKFYCVPISTGEKPLVTDQDEGGANNRVLAIRVKDGDSMVPDAPRFCQEVLDKSWGHAAEPWINAIKDLDYDAIKAEVFDIVAKLKAQGKAEKQAIAAGVLLVADRLAEENLFHDGVRLTEQDIMPILKDDSYVDDRQRAYDAMCSMISENGNCFVDGAYKPNGKTWGKLEDGGNRVIFNADIFNKEMRARGFDPSMFIDWAIDQGVIEDGRLSGDHKHLARKLRIESGTAPVWCYVIDMKHEPGTIPTGFANVSETTKVDDVFDQEKMDV